MRTGVAHLPLHGGKAPRWLFQRMVKLAREIVCFMVSEHGAIDVLTRLSDPFWFQAFGCVLGFDWHSSGVTTTTCGAIKEGIKGLEDDLGFFAAGGKGGTSRKTPAEIATVCERLSIDADPLVRASRMSAKVDSAAVQDGYQVYHHAFFFLADGRWSVVQQGMNDASGMARRYHWRGDRVSSFVNEPHAAICCDARQQTLNLVASESEPVRDASTSIAAQPFDETLMTLNRVPNLKMPRRHPISMDDIDSRHIRKVLIKTYEDPPEDYEALLGVSGVGPKTLRALSLISELVYGATACTRDPARYAFAHGGKDGTPFPVDRPTYDQTIDILNRALNRASVDRSEKIKAFRRLTRFEAARSQ